MIILGSTGSIGRNALKLAFARNINVEALSCAKNYELLNEQIAKFKPKFVCIGDLKFRSFVKHSRVFCGENGLKEMIFSAKSKVAINAIVGFAGLMPSVYLQQSGKILTLANKESLVVGGKFLDTDAINPIDSEHFGLKFLLKNRKDFRRLIITASGGAFYKTPLKSLNSVTPQMALKHPNWNMGAKITIDSATMANKLFEIMEAFWLFGTKNIDALIEKTSSIHALVEFIDGSTTAHISKTDMILAIANAIFPNPKNVLDHADLTKLEAIKFDKISPKKYPIFSLKNELLNNPNLGVVINAANEIGVYGFLAKKCSFLDISRCIFQSLEKFPNHSINSLDELCEIDKEVRKFALSVMPKG